MVLGTLGILGPGLDWGPRSLEILDPKLYCCAGSLKILASRSDCSPRDLEVFDPGLYWSPGNLKILHLSWIGIRRD